MVTTRPLIRHPEQSEGSAGIREILRRGDDKTKSIPGYVVSIGTPL